METGLKVFSNNERDNTYMLFLIELNVESGLASVSSVLIW